MEKIGIVMIVAGIFISTGWTMYGYWQMGNTNKVFDTLCAILFASGAILIGVGVIKKLKK